MKKNRNLRKRIRSKIKVQQQKALGVNFNEKLQEFFNGILPFIYLSWCVEKRWWLLHNGYIFLNIDP